MKVFFLVASWIVRLISEGCLASFLHSLINSKSLKMPKGSVAIISEPEPQIEEASEYAVIANWFSRIGVQSYLLRVSGHYYPFELGTILKTIKPKQVIPIHTERPELMKSIAKSV